MIILCLEFSVRKKKFIWNWSGTYLNKTITIIARLLLKHLLGYICRSYDDKTSVIMLWSMMPHIMTRLSTLRPLYCTLVPLFSCPLSSNSAQKPTKNRTLGKPLCLPLFKNYFLNGVLPTYHVICCTVFPFLDHCAPIPTTYPWAE